MVFWCALSFIRSQSKDLCNGFFEIGGYKKGRSVEKWAYHSDGGIGSFQAGSFTSNEAICRLTTGTRYTDKGDRR